MNYGKKGLALLLAITILCSAIPQIAYASEITETQVMPMEELDEEQPVESESTESIESEEGIEKELPAEADSLEEELPAEMNGPEEDVIKDENRGEENNAESEMVVPDMPDESKEDVLPIVPEAVSSESLQEGEIPYFTESDIWVNPLYENIIGEDELQDSEDIQTALFSEQEYLDSVEAAGEVLREGMKERLSSITVYYQFEGDFDVSIAREEIFPEALKHTGNPVEGDYLMWQYAGCRTTASYKIEDGINYVTWVFTITYYTDSDQEEEMNSSVSVLLDELDLESKNDYEKIYAIYDYICRNITYDQENLSDNDNKLKFTAYAALINHTAVCQGYAVLFYRLALEAGIDCRLIPGMGNGESHGWNIVRLNNFYYNLDTTWDAVSIKTGEGYQYFLKSEDNFKDHIRSAEYDTSEFHAEYPMSDRNYQFGVQNPRIVQDSSMKSGQKVTYDCIWYGSYPQTEVSEGDIYEQLKRASDWNSDDDITILGQKYHRENGKYFIWEPLKWRVLDIDGTGTALLQADSILAGKNFGENDQEISWYDSDIRNWLNGSFAQQAFTESEKEKLAVKERKLVFIGDSYLEGYTSDGIVESWGAFTDKYLGCETATYYKGGCGFDNMGGFQSLLPDAMDDSITDVIVLGGRNDRGTSEKIEEAIKEFVDQCRQIYPNAKIHIGMIGFDTDSSRYDRETVLKEYIKASEENGCNYIWGIEDALCGAYMASDGKHPNSKGQEAIGKALASYLLDSVTLLEKSQVYGTESAMRSGFSIISESLDEARRRQATDYAVEQGISGDSGQYGGNWWLRSVENGRASFVYDMGDVCRIGHDPEATGIGLCPVIRLNLENAGSWSYAGTFCTDRAFDERDGQDFLRKNGIVADDAGVRYYYVEGMIDWEMTGLVDVEGNYFYIKNGKVNDGFTGIATHTDGVRYYVKNGCVDIDLNGLVRTEDGRWYYIQNGKVNEDFTGLVKHSDNKWYYVDQGMIDWNYSGVAVNAYGHWYCVKKGIYDFSQNGLVYYDGVWYYVNHGEWNKDYQGYVKHIDNKWYYVKNGKIDFSFTGLAKHTDGKWYYAYKGVIDWNYTGLAQNIYGSWYYVKKGNFDSSFNGLIQYRGTWYYLHNGYLDWNYTNLVLHTDKNWYYVDKGKINWDYTGLVQYCGTWYYVQKGKLNWDYTGLTLYYGTWYYVQKGKLNWNYTGLVYHTDKNWYYVQKGKIVWDYTSLVQHTDKGWYYVRNAKIDWNYTGLVQYYSTWYYVQKGKLNWDYTGLVQYYSTWYYVQKGKLNWNYTGLVYHTDKNWYYVQKGRIIWGHTDLVQHTDKVWYYVENSKINWNYTGPFQYYGTWYYIQRGKLNWNYNGNGTYNGIPYTVRDGYVYFADQEQLKVESCRISGHTESQVTITLTAVGTMGQSASEYYLLMMNSGGTTVMKAIPASVSQNGKWQCVTKLTSSDAFKDIVMAQYAIGAKTGNGYRRISDFRMIENPEIMATMTADYKGYYTSNKITSKKGMQGASDGYTEDIGVQHVLLNVDLAQMISPYARSGYVPYTYKGTTYYFQDMIALVKTMRYLNGWDNDNPYGWHNRSVTLVLLMSWKDDLSYLIHPSARRKGAAAYYTLNMKEQKARDTFEALFCYMGEKLGDNKSLVSNWTLGNEVNSCNVWNYSGNMSLSENVSNYAQAFQLLYQGVRRTAGTSRVFISLDHCWNTAEAGYSGKAFLDEFASYMNHTAPAMQWNVNFHPYSQPITRNTFWADNSNTIFSTGTAYISMKNIQVLTDYLTVLEDKYHKDNGSIRIIIGEIGYTARSGNTSEEKQQAAALGYGYYIAMFNKRIDAYIARAYVDDSAETSSGLYLGMFDCTYYKKEAYDVYKNLDTSQSLNYMNRYLGMIGISNWESVIPGFDAKKLVVEDF